MSQIINTLSWIRRIIGGLFGLILCHIWAIYPSKAKIPNTPRPQILRQNPNPIANGLEDPDEIKIADSDENSEANEESSENTQAHNSEGEASDDVVVEVSECVTVLCCNLHITGSKFTTRNIL